MCLAFTGLMLFWKCSKTLETAKLSLMGTLVRTWTCTAPAKAKREIQNDAVKSNGYYFTVNVCRTSNIKRLGTVWVNYTENNISTEDTARTLCWVCQERSGVRSVEFHYEPVGKYYASMKPLGNLNLLFPFLPKPAKWDLLGLFWVCWRIIFPCAVVGRETERKSAAKPTCAEPNWWDSSLLQCSVIPDDTMLCLSPSFSLCTSASFLCVIFLFWTSETGLSRLSWVVSLSVCFCISCYSLVSFYSLSVRTWGSISRAALTLLVLLLGTFLRWSFFGVCFMSPLLISTKH